MDTVSNGGFLPFSAGGILSPLPGDLARQYGPCDYDVRQNFTAQYVYQLPFKGWRRYRAPFSGIAEFRSPSSARHTPQMVTGLSKAAERNSRA